eukprot:5618197-Pleurochrysis_carterae.AAC.4
MARGKWKPLPLTRKRSHSSTRYKSRLQKGGATCETTPSFRESSLRCMHTSSHELARAHRGGSRLDLSELGDVALERADLLLLLLPRLGRQRHPLLLLLEEGAVVAVV